MVRLLLVGCLTIATTMIVAAQAPTFEVASVKPSPPDGSRGTGGGPVGGGRYVASSSALTEIMQRAFEQYSRPGMIIGGPAWTRSERFTIEARAVANATPAQMRLMMQQLLRDRFALRTHTEPRAIDVYVLVKARSDGRLGPKLRASSVDCDAVRAGRGIHGPIAADPAKGDRPPCASNSGMDANGIVHLSETWKLDQLTVALQAWMIRAVINRTGLEGFYDFDLEFDFATRNAPDPVASAGASIFTALQEQLGLKLDARREMMDVLVIDSAERPMPD